MEYWIRSLKESLSLTLYAHSKQIWWSAGVSTNSWLPRALCKLGGACYFMRIVVANFVCIFNKNAKQLLEMRNYSIIAIPLQTETIHCLSHRSYRSIYVKLYEFNCRLISYTYYYTEFNCRIIPYILLKILHRPMLQRPIWTERICSVKYACTPSAQSFRMSKNNI